MMPNYPQNLEQKSIYFIDIQKWRDNYTNYSTVLHVKSYINPSIFRIILSKGSIYSLVSYFLHPNYPQFLESNIN